MIDQMPPAQGNKGSQLDETKRNIAELEAQLAKMEAGEGMDAESGMSRNSRIGRTAMAPVSF